MGWVKFEEGMKQRDGVYVVLVKSDCGLLFYNIANVLNSANIFIQNMGGYEIVAIKKVEEFYGVFDEE